MLHLWLDNLALCLPHMTALCMLCSDTACALALSFLATSTLGAQAGSYSSCMWCTDTRYLSSVNCYGAILVRLGHLRTNTSRFQPASLIPSSAP